MVLNATPVPLVTEPPSVTRPVVAAPHLPLVAAGLNVTLAFVVPLPPAHFIDSTNVPDLFGFDLNVPVPEPPVAVVGVHELSVTLTTLLTVFVFNLVHCGTPAADAGTASGTASNDADAARIATPRIENFMHIPLGRATDNRRHSSAPPIACFSRGGAEAST